MIYYPFRLTQNIHGTNEIRCKNSVKFEVITGVNNCLVVLQHSLFMGCHVGD
jgi:hypothetical protein